MKPGFKLADTHPSAKAQAGLDGTVPSPSSVAAATTAAPTAAPASPSALTAVQFREFVARQESLNDAIARHGPTSNLGKAAKAQLDKLNSDFGAHFG